MLGAAFDAFMALEKRLLKEDSPATFVDIPSSLAEWDKKKATKRAERQRNGALIQRWTPYRQGCVDYAKGGHSILPTRSGRRRSSTPTNGAASCKI